MNNEESLKRFLRRLHGECGIDREVKEGPEYDRPYDPATHLEVMNGLAPADRAKVEEYARLVAGREK